MSVRFGSFQDLKPLGKCPVCQVDFERNQAQRIWCCDRCSRSAHVKCMCKWVTQNKNVTCPYSSSTYRCTAFISQEDLREISSELDSAVFHLQDDMREVHRKLNNLESNVDKIVNHLGIK